MVFINGVKNIQAAAYCGAPTVFKFEHQRGKKLQKYVEHCAIARNKMRKMNKADEFHVVR